MKGLFAAIIISFFAIAMINKLEVETSVADNSNISTDNNAQELYRFNCAGCHGMDRQGNPPTFPSLVNIKDKKSKAEIVTQVKMGSGAMPSLAHLSEAEINAIVGYLYDDEQEETLVVDFAPIKKGEMLFKSNCTGCHRTITTDAKPQNADTKMCGMMEPATLSGVPDWYTKKEFTKVLDKGPCYMPSFSFMNQEDKDVVYDYLASLDDPDIPQKPGGMMMRKKGKRKHGWMCN